MRFVVLTSLLTVIGCRSDEGIQKFNSPPEANITSHGDGDSILEGYPITLIGTGSDSNHGSDDLTAIWYAGSTVICEGKTLDENGTTTCEYIANIDNTAFTLVIQDPENASGEASVNLQVTPSDAPTATINSPLASGKFYSDQKITFEGVVSDGEDDAEDLSITWNSDIDGDLSIANQPNDSGEVDGATYLTEGEHYIRLAVADTTGKEGSDNVTITVGPPNAAPLCEITSPTNNSAGATGNVVQFTATTSDVDIPADMLTLTWSSDKDGELGSSTPSSTGEVLFMFSDLSVNAHTITMTVTDEIGATCTDFIAYTVGTPPTITIDQPMDGEIYSEGDILSFAATVSDAQDQPDEVTLDWQLNGTPFSTQGATSTGTAMFSDSSLAFGAYNLIVTATDSDGLTDSNQVNFTINGLPSQPNISINPNPATTGDQLSVNLDTPSTDPEGNTITYNYQWLLGGAIQSAYTASLLPSSATNKGEQWTVRVTPNDGIADGPSAETSLVVQNTPPSVASVTITPATNVYTDSNLTCSAVVSDPDETVTPTFTWMLNSTIVGTGSTLDLTTINAHPNDVVTCSVLATDGDGETAIDSATTTIENRSPVVDSITLSPSTVYTDDTITATAVFSDADGQTISANYAWHVIDFATGTDTEVQNGTDHTLSGTTHFNRDDEVYVVVTPNDGIDDGTPLSSNSTTIANTAPGSITISSSPDPATQGQDDLLCSVDVGSTDADGDALVYTYVWTDPNGVVQQTTTNTTNTSDTFSASATTEGTWTCQVTPSDGTDDGPTALTYVTVNEEENCISVAFDQVGDAVQMGPDNGVLEFGTGDLTFNVVFKVNSLGGTQQIMMKGYNPELQLDPDGTIRAFFRAGGCGNFTTNTKVVPGVWYNVTFNRENGNTALYVNGVLETTSTATSCVSSSSEQLLFGTQGNGGEPFYGQIHRASFWDRALSSTEIYNLYQNGATGNEPNLLGYWDFSTQSAGVVTDHTSNANHGTLQGATWVNSCPTEDNDGDGYTNWEDCNDNDASIHPYAGDIYGDGIDSDCDGLDCQAASDGNTYFLVCETNFWSAIDSYCASGGYEFGSIQSDAENDHIENLFRGSSLYGSFSTANGSVIWMNYTNASGNWQWGDGYTGNYSNWAPGMPDQSNGCAYMDIDGSGGSWPLGSWDDTSCSGGDRASLCTAR